MWVGGRISMFMVGLVLLATASTNMVFLTRCGRTLNPKP